MEELNSKVTDRYCDICGVTIRNKQKHLETKKHKKEVDDCLKMIMSFKRIGDCIDNNDIDTAIKLCVDEIKK